MKKMISIALLLTATAAPAHANAKPWWAGWVGGGGKPSVSCGVNNEQSPILNFFAWTRCQY